MGPVAAVPMIVTKCKILKRFRVLENESIFPEFQHFSCARKSIFLEQFRKIEHIIQNFLKFLKNYFKISKFPLFWSHLINPENFPVNSIIYDRNLLKNQQNWLRSRKTIWNGNERSWKFWRKSTVFVYRNSIWSTGDE